MNRRGFLKGGIATGVGALFAKDTFSVEPNKKNYYDVGGRKIYKEGYGELANFQDGKLKRNFNGNWTLMFSSPNKFSPSGIKNLIVEIGGYKFELISLKEIETIETKKSNLFYYELKGNDWIKLSESELI